MRYRERYLVAPLRSAQIRSTEASTFPQRRDRALLRAPAIGCFRDFLDDHITHELRWVRRCRRKFVAVKELEDGDAIVEFLLEVMRDDSARNADRIDAAKRLSDRGFGRSIQGVDVVLTTGVALDLSQISLADKKATLEILDRYDPDISELADRGSIPVTSDLD